MRQLVYTTFITNNHASFLLWFKGNLVKYQTVSKYYVHDSSLGLKTGLSIVNKFLLAGDKFMSEMHLGQPGSTYNACRLFAKSKERIQKFKETGDSIYIQQNELDNACFENDIAYEDFKDLPRTTASDKVLLDKAFNIGKNPKYNGYQHVFASMVYNFLIKSLPVLMTQLVRFGADMSTITT